MHVQMALFAHAAERLYRVAYIVPPSSSIPRNQAYTVKLPVPTVVMNATLMVEIIQITPISHRMRFMDQLQPLLQFLITKWTQLSAYATLESLQKKTEVINALRQVTLMLHTVFPTAGLPGERMMVPGFSLAASNDQLVLQKSRALTSRFQELARQKANQLYAVAAKYDLQIAENLNRADPFATWDIANPAVYATEPQLCFMPVHMQEFKTANFSYVGHPKTVGKIII